MKLLVFAHRNEARSFLKKRDFSPISLPFDGLYGNGEELLLITKEGILNCTLKLSAVCGLFHDTIDTVINPGIAGVLREEMETGGIHEVRTCYAEGEFKSFTSSAKDSEKLVDCISANERVRDKKKAFHLSCFAQLVDRECWAVGSVCSVFKLPFHCFKLASDRTDDNCRDILKKASGFSEHLHSFYDRLSFSAAPTKTRPPIDEGFYFTVSQKNHYHALMEKLKIKWRKNEREVLSSLKTGEIFQMSNIPKKRSGILLARMKENLAPKGDFRV